MSDNFLRLIPIDPRHVPEAVKQTRALSAARAMFPGADSVEVGVSERVQFIDQGGNFVAVRCPACHSTLDIEWWGDAMDESYRSSHFDDLVVRTPCCSAATSLNDLEYDWPAGFARFVLEAMNPGRDLRPRELAELESALGCSLRVVWTHV